MTMCDACQGIDMEKRPAHGHFHLLPTGPARERRFRCRICDTQWRRLVDKSGAFIGWTLAA